MNISFKKTYFIRNIIILPGEYEIELLINAINLIPKYGTAIEIIPDLIRNSKMKVTESKSRLSETDDKHKDLLIIRIPEATEWVFILSIE